MFDITFVVIAKASKKNVNFAVSYALVQTKTINISNNLYSTY